MKKDPAFQIDEEKEENNNDYLTDTKYDSNVE